MDLRWLGRSRWLEDAVFLDGFEAHPLRFGSAIAFEKILNLRRIGRPQNQTVSLFCSTLCRDELLRRPFPVGVGGYTQDSH